MKANPVYKCKRCGEIIIKADIQLEADELSCAETISTHICDVRVWIDKDKINDSYSSSHDVGIIELVGYNEVKDV